MMLLDSVGGAPLASRGELRWRKGDVAIDDASLQLKSAKAADVRPSSLPMQATPAIERPPIRKHFPVTWLWREAVVHEL